VGGGRVSTIFSLSASAPDGPSPALIDRPTTSTDYSDMLGRSLKVDLMHTWVELTGCLRCLRCIVGVWGAGWSSHWDPLPTLEGAAGAEDDTWN
jgi:hypothetical protein